LDGDATTRENNKIPKRLEAITIQLIHGYVKRSVCFELSPRRMAARGETLVEPHLSMVIKIYLLLDW
jgi:hypothetical protein